MKNENIKFNNKIESFLDKASDNLGNNLLANTEFTKKFINGNWTTLNTTVDSNYNVQNLMEVNIIDYNMVNKNYGTITIQQNTIYNITYLSDENIICVNQDNNDATIHIKLINNFNKNDDKLKVGLDYQNNIPKCIISQYIGNNLLYNYISYKVYNNKVNSELYRIILAGDYYIGKLPPIYNYYVYNKIINNYVYPSNYISIDNFINDNRINQNTINKLRDKYNGNLKFCIQRVFNTPSNGNTEIITRISQPITLNVLNGNNVPNKLKVIPFKEDKISNNLKNFFDPKATILYFYAFTDSNDSYGYSKDKVNLETRLLSLSSINRSNNMFDNPLIYYDDVSSVEKVITNNYTLARVKQIYSNMDDDTFFNFSDLYSLI
jgi:hypothetical protein